MVLSNPATKAEFFDLLPIQEVQLRLDRQVQINNLGGGEILQAELFPPVWVGSVSLAPMPKRQAAEIQAYLATLEAPGRVFHAYKAHQIGPETDPVGADIEGFSPILEDVGGVPDKLRLGGLPQGYVLRPGDFVAFDYDNGTGARRAYHQFTQQRTANTASAYSDFSFSSFAYVVPPLRPGSQLGASVELVKPDFLAVLVPGSVSYGITRGNVTSGMQFEFRQTLKV